eukprot:EG_transcript_10720
MPADGVALTPASHLLSVPEILRLARLFVSLGVSKVRLTGGEPLVHPEVEALCAGLGAIAGVRQLTLTTNGIRLARKLPALQAAGVTGVNISLDTMDPDRFIIIARRSGLTHVLQGIEAALEHKMETKVNCVVMRGVNEDELPRFVELTRDQPLDMRFIEFMPFDDNKWNDGKFFSYKEMIERIKLHHPTLTRESEGPHDTAKRWRVPGFRGSVGFITSMTDHFCGGCNRLRLTADGHLKVCLFGEAEVNLKRLLTEGASDMEVADHIRAAVHRKHFSHGGHADMYAIARGRNRSMIRIGG